MAFTEFLKSKQRFIIIWLAIHGLALFVNLFGIEGNISSRNDSSGRKDYTSFRLFTKDRGEYSYDPKPSEDFWPFVGFYKSKVSYNPYMQRKEDFSSFNGIFYQYDISEFIAYNLILLLIFYFMWSGKKPSSKP